MKTLRNGSSPRVHTSCIGVLAAVLPVVLGACRPFPAVPMAPSVPRAKTPPNFVVVLADDQGCGDASYRGNPRLKTPNLDRLAAEGTVLTNFHVSPVCAPTRAALMTGRYHLRTGVRGVIGGREFLPLEEKTAAEYLRDEGYRTAIFGKWHLGEFYPHVPARQGFDEFAGFRSGGSTYFDAVLEDENGKPRPTQGYLTHVITDMAMEFLQRNQKNPFFLYLPYNAPHSPLEVPDRYVEPYRDLPNATAKVYGMMAALDENLGRLLRRLDELGLRDNTYVLYTSDNGPLWNGDESRYNCGLRGKKYDVLEGGVRVPLIVRAPGRVPAGRELPAAAAHVDLLPTLLGWAGVTNTAGNIDGRDLGALIEGRSRSLPTPRNLYLHYPREHPLSKPFPDAPYPGGMLLSERYKMVNGKELYDLVADPGETQDLSARQPAELQRLDSEFRAWFARANQERPHAAMVEAGHRQENPARVSAHVAALYGGPRYGMRGGNAMRDIGVHSDFITNWHALTGRAEWNVRFVTAGRYQLGIRLRCDGPAAGATVELAVGSTLVHHTIDTCGASGDAWIDKVIGQMDVPAGDQKIVLRALDKLGPRVPDFDELILEKL